MMAKALNTCQGFGCFAWRGVALQLIVQNRFCNEMMSHSVIENFENDTRSPVRHLAYNGVPICNPCRDGTNGIFLSPSAQRETDKFSACKLKSVVKGFHVRLSDGIRRFIASSYKVLVLQVIHRLSRLQT